MAEFIFFREKPHPDPNRKTGIWEVVSKSQGTALGHISWYGSWRQYAFFPKQQTTYSSGCMEDIASFIRERMEERRKWKTKEREA